MSVAPVDIVGRTVTVGNISRLTFSSARYISESSRDDAPAGRKFAVIGSTVNAASRLEALTRTLNCALVASDDLVRKAKAEVGGGDTEFQPLVAQAPQLVRGLEQPMAIWTQARLAA